MKKAIPITACLVIIASIACIAAASPVYGNESEKSEINMQTTVEKYEKYIIKDYNGKIAVFKDDSTEPLQVYDVFTSSLPEKDATELKSGITANDKKELESLVADYTS